MLPADMLNAMPNAARRPSASSPASRPTAAAAPNTPQTAVGCSPCRYSSAGPSSSPRLAIAWYPVAALSSTAAVVAGMSTAAASSAVQITVPGCELDGSWVSSSSMLCALIPLTSAASRIAAVRPVPRTGAGPADRGSRASRATRAESASAPAPATAR